MEPPWRSWLSRRSHIHYDPALAWEILRSPVRSWSGATFLFGFSLCLLDFSFWASMLLIREMYISFQALSISLSVSLSLASCLALDSMRLYMKHIITHTHDLSTLIGQCIDAFPTQCQQAFNRLSTDDQQIINETRSLRDSTLASSNNLE